MATIPHHHSEWLSLLEVSGPFLSMPVLLQAFPQGLDAHDSDHAATLRAAHEEWLDNQNGLRPETAIHTAWVHYVLEQSLGYTKDVLLEGQAIPNGLRALIAEHGETLRPDYVLQAPGGDSKPRLLIQVYPIEQKLDRPVAGSRWQASAAVRMMELLHATGVRLGLVTNGEQWMLVDAPSGETTGYISWYAGLWFEEQITLRAFRSLLGAYRFFGVPDAQTLEALLAASAQDQHEVTDQLGYQVRRAVEILIQAVDRADQDRRGELLAGMGTNQLYEAALTVMMRLVFLLSAEERKLLPSDDPFYAQYYAVSTLRAQLHEVADQTGEEVLERRFDAWSRLLATFRAVFSGVRHDRLNLPAYGGSLFNPDRYPFLEGRLPGTSWQETPAQPLPINNRTVLHLLDALQVLQVKVPGGMAEARRLSFRALDVEQIGHVYEGLLDHRAARAEGPVLGLTGTKDKEPEIALADLEAMRAKGEKELLAFLKEQTGRSEAALRNALKPLDLLTGKGRLRSACGNEDALYHRVLPFAGLIRDDDFGFPTVIPTGSVYVTTGTTRRATGTHYTPRSLTEPIVQHTLEPLVYAGPAEGLPKEQWQLRSPRELLDLKVCDMAMGSAGFLVQADRYLAERLVEAWLQAEERHGIERRPVQQSQPVEAEASIDALAVETEMVEAGAVTPAQPPADQPARVQLYLTPEGLLTDDPARAIPADAEDRLVFARRLVAERCLYGVDKNPLAVEIAKLSLWLVTLAKERPFTFVDHALKCGDSLVGADEKMFKEWAYSRRDSAFTLYHSTLEEMIELARQKRRELESFSVRDVRDAERKSALLREADDAVERIKLGCDLLVGVRLLGLKESEQEELLARLLWNFVAGQPMDGYDAQRALNAARKERAFHWFFEFPEAFERGGFNAFIGNPPFLGGKRISTNFGEKYKEYLHLAFPSAENTADLVSYFFVKSFNLLSVSGIVGLIATNTISQGDTRETGLEAIVKNGGVIVRAYTSAPWPGSAAVFVSIVLISKGRFTGAKVLDNQITSNITSFLEPGEEISGNPFKLEANSGLSYNGEYILGTGFLLTPEEANDLIKLDGKNREVILPFINGEDLNTSPEQKPSRYAIDFFDWPLEKAEQYTDCMKIVREKVYPQRKAQNDKFGKENWWRYMRSRPEMHQAIKNLSRVLVIAQTSKTLGFVFLPKGIIYSHALSIVASDKSYDFAVLQSSFHISWVLKYASSLKGDARYIPSDCFENYPFPKQKVYLQQIGDAYYEYRKSVMISNQAGLTATYNRFHNPDERASDIARLQDLHVEMDNAVAAAYGWNDLDLGHGFHETAQGMRFTISESARREVLARLLKLNHERHEEEVLLGLHDGKKGKGAAASSTATNSGGSSSRASRGANGSPVKGSRTTPAASAAGSSPTAGTAAAGAAATAPRTRQVREVPAASGPSPAQQEQPGLFNLPAEPAPTLLTRLPFGGFSGNVYRCPMPFSRYDPHQQAYAEMKQKQVNTVVLLVSDAEAREQSGRDLRQLYQQDGLHVLHLPIPDFGIPDPYRLEWAVEEVARRARAGENVAVHCLAGAGRTGLFMAELAKKALKMTGDSALYWVRLYIPGAVESKEQVAFVKRK